MSHLRELAVQRGGRLVLLRAPAEIKTAVDVWGEVGDGLALMKRLKDGFDPEHRLGAGRFVGGI